MRILLSLALLFGFASVFGQDPETKSIVLEGYIFSEDSVPVENAHLINYRTSKIVTTNKDGYFRVGIHTGDSLMVNHLSLTPKVLYTDKSRKNEKISVYIPYRTYIIKAISSGNYEKETKNMEESMKQVRKDKDNQIVVKPYHRTMENPYDNDKQNPGITIPILQLGAPDKKKTDTDNK